jgi:hypothetical protein
MNFWARDFNFTWDVHDNINGDWGLKPKSGKPHFIFSNATPCPVPYNTKFFYPYRKYRDPCVPVECLYM